MGVEIFLIILALIALSIVLSTGNYELYKNVFKIHSCKEKSLTHKTWFRGLWVPFIYIPGLNIIGFIILLYILATRILDINRVLRN